MTPASRRIAPRSRARYTVGIRRRRWRGTVRLWIGQGLPAGAYARFVPATTRRSGSMLIVITSAHTPPGTYRLRLRAAGRSRSAMRIVTMRITGHGSVGPVSSAPFAIAGDAGVLEPGVSQPLDLSLTNPNKAPLAVYNLAVSIASVNAPNASPALPCTLADFSVQQFTGAYPLVVPGSSTRTLSALGVPSAHWPQIAIVDSPSDQDGCLGAYLRLSYGGSATFR